MQEYSSNTNELRICLVALGAPFDKLRVRLKGRLQLFNEFSDDLYMIIDKMPELDIEYLQNKDNIINLNVVMFQRGSNKNGLTFLNVLIKYSLIQLKMIWYFLKIRNKIDIFVFTTGIPLLFPQIILARLMNKKVVLLGGGTAFYSSIAGKADISLGIKCIKIIEESCYKLSTVIAGETPGAVKFLKLDKYINKIKFFGALIYIDTNNFKIIKPISNRKKIVGFISDLTIRKGILNLIDAEISVLKRRNDIDFFIGGDGPLLEETKNIIDKSGYKERIKLIGRVDDSEMLYYLNEAKLIVLPTYSEGLPGIILESMACGTPVLATKIGGIPDIIIDGETGFIIEENTPRSIALNIERAIDSPNLDHMSKNVRMIIKENYSFQATAKRYEEIFADIIND